MATGDDALDETEPADHAGVRGSAAAAETALVAGKRYQPIDELARGGIGRIVRARDLAFDRIVAIKEPLDVVQGGERLRAEAAILASLQHPSIIAVFDAGTREDGVPFFAMKLVDGRSLRDVIADAKTLEQRLGLIHHVIAIAEAMAYAHGQAVIHRDLKPANVLVGAFDETVVIDWGLAKVLGAEQDTVDGRGKGTPRSGPQPSTITNTGDVMGTPAYMAPEQARGERVDARADVYALGAILYHLLAGAAPYSGPRRGDDTLPRVLLSSPDPIEVVQPRVPDDLAAIVANAMAREPGDRYATAAGFADDLVRYRAGKLVSARRYSLPARMGRFLLRHRGVVAAIALAAVVGVGALVLRPSRATPAVAPAPPDAGVRGLADLGAAHLITSYGADGCAYASAYADDDTVVYDLTLGDAVDLYALSLSGGSTRQLTSAPTWEWNAQRGRTPGEVVHLVHDLEDFNKSWIGALDLATGVDTRLLSVHARDVAASGDAVYYTNRDGTKLHRWSAGRDEIVRSADEGSGFNTLAVSPDGAHLVFAGPSPEGFYACVVPTSDPTATCDPIEVMPMRPAFSPDGTALYYATAAGIRRRVLDTGDDSMVIPDGRGEASIAIAPDGGALLYSECGARSQLVDVLVTPARAIVDDDTAMFPTIGPEGLLAWTHVDHDHTVLMIRTAAGEIRQLTSGSLGSVTAPAISPNGRRVAFVVAGEAPGLYAVDVRQFGVPQRVTSGALDRMPSWLDDDRLVFTRFDANQIQSAWTVALSSGEEQPIGKTSRYAVAVDNLTGDALLSGGANLFFWWSPKTGRERPGPVAPTGTTVYAFVSPNGRWMGFQVGTNAREVWRRRLEPAGELEHVWTAGPSQTLDRAAITDDGDVIAAPQTWSGDLRLVPAAAGSRF